MSVEELLNRMAETYPRRDLLLEPDPAGGSQVRDTASGRVLLELDDLGRPVYVHPVYSGPSILVEEAVSVRWGEIRTRRWATLVPKDHQPTELSGEEGEAEPISYSELTEPWTGDE